MKDSFVVTFFSSPRMFEARRKYARERNIYEILSADVISGKKWILSGLALETCFLCWCEGLSWRMKTIFSSFDNSPSCILIWVYLSTASLSSLFSFKSPTSVEFKKLFETPPFRKSFTFKSSNRFRKFIVWAWLDVWSPASLDFLLPLFFWNAKEFTD